MLLTIFDVCRSLRECTFTIMPMHTVTDIQQNVQMNMATLNSNYESVQIILPEEIVTSIKKVVLIVSFVVINYETNVVY